MCDGWRRRGKPHLCSEGGGRKGRGGLIAGGLALISFHERRPVAGRLVCRPTMRAKTRNSAGISVWMEERSPPCFLLPPPLLREIRSKRIENQRWIVVETYFSFPFSTPSPGNYHGSAASRATLDLRHWREFRQFTTLEKRKEKRERERVGRKERGFLYRYYQAAR